MSAQAFPFIFFFPLHLSAARTSTLIPKIVRIRFFFRFILLLKYLSRYHIWRTTEWAHVADDGCPYIAHIGERYSFILAIDQMSQSFSVDLSLSGYWLWTTTPKQASARAVRGKFQLGFFFFYVVAVVLSLPRWNRKNGHRWMCWYPLRQRISATAIFHNHAQLVIGTRSLCSAVFFLFLSSFLFIVVFLE